MAHYECKCCDSPFGSEKVEEDIVCSNCGAEWEYAKILVEDDEE